MKGIILAGGAGSRLYPLTAQIESSVAGVKMRPVDEALEHSLQNWVPEK